MQVTANGQMWLVEVRGRAVAMQLQVALTTTLVQSEYNLVPLQRPWHYSAHQSDSGRNHQHTRAHELTSATPASLQHAWHRSVPQSDSACNHKRHTRARGVTVDSQQQVFEVRAVAMQLQVALPTALAQSD
jgi:hypothetical protein